MAYCDKISAVVLPQGDNPIFTVAMAYRQRIYYNTKDEKLPRVNPSGTVSIPTRASHLLSEKSIYIIDKGDVACSPLVGNVCQALRLVKKIRNSRTACFLRKIGEPVLFVSLSGQESITELQQHLPSAGNVKLLPSQIKANRSFYHNHKIEDDTPLPEDETIGTSPKLQLELFQRLLRDIKQQGPTFLGRLGKTGATKFPPGPWPQPTTIVLVSKLMGYLPKSKDEDAAIVLAEMCQSKDYQSLEELGYGLYIPPLLEVWDWFTRGGNALFLKELAQCAEDNLLEFLWECTEYILEPGEYEVFSVTVENLRKCKNVGDILEIKAPCSFCDKSVPIYVDCIMECHTEDVSNILCTQWFYYLAKPENPDSVKFQNVYKNITDFPVHFAAKFCHKSFFHKLLVPLCFSDREKVWEPGQTWDGLDHALHQGLKMLRVRCHVEEAVPPEVINSIYIPLFINFILRKKCLEDQEENIIELLPKLTGFCESINNNDQTMQEMINLIKKMILCSRDSQDYTPLHHACKRGNVEIIKILCHYGADPTLQDEYGATPFHRAARYAPLEALKILLEHGADVNQFSHQLGTSLHQACLRDGKDAVDVIKFLLEKGAELNVPGPDIMGTPLCQTLKCDMGQCSEVAGFLLKRQGVDIKPLFERSGSICTPFMSACLDGHESVVRSIIKKFKSLPDPEQEVLCAKYGSRGLPHNPVKFLLNREGDPRSGWTPLHAAALHDNGGMAKFLMEEGAELVLSTGTILSPLHLAAGTGAARFLLGVKGKVGLKLALDVCFGLTPLDISQSYRHDECAKELVTMLVGLIGSGVNNWI